MSYTNDKILPAWYIPGWSVQGASYPLNIPGNNVTNPFPSALSMRDIVGTFYDTEGCDRTGYITFKPSVHYVTYRPDEDTPAVTITATRQKMFLHNGQLTTSLLATDNLHTQPSSFTYEVTEHWLNGRTYHISVPRSADVSPAELDINDLIVSTPTPDDSSDGILAIEFYPGDSYNFYSQHPAGTDLTGYTGSLYLRSYGTQLLVKTAAANVDDRSFTIVISPSETATLATDDVTDYIFRIANSDSSEIDTLASGPVTVLQTYGG